MIVAFTEMRLKGDLNRFDGSNSISEKAEITAANYIKLSNLDPRVTIIGSEMPGLEVKSVKGDMLQHLEYEMIGDTLHIISMKMEEKQLVNLTIHVPKSTFRGLSSSHCGVIISNLQQASLDIEQKDGWIRMSDSNKIGQLNLIAQNTAYFNFLKGEIDILNTSIDDSEVSIPQPMKLVKGSMSNNSYLYLDGASEIQFKKDESSRLILN
ncbi:hypothetical protein [Marivirga tractuosa]|uniref:Uncharacterized protein n=2 Tax=Marivirga TaxID=869806 RepID=E4TUW5_MARTH|nr:hypothetical protein [Marivirga tractuosa]ADR21070.1 hypothetical protein Ftrac_1074 [Marivirga tractuosa DSM 4126]